jgi:hypothetical protein
MWPRSGATHSTTTSMTGMPIISGVTGSSISRTLRRQQQEARHLRIAVTGLVSEFGIDMDDIVAPDYEAMQILGVPFGDIAVALLRVERRHQIERKPLPGACCG